MLMIGSVVMNRVESPWFPATIEGVLNQPHQFVRGSRYDEQSLKAAREIMMGRSVVPDYVLYVHALDSQNDWGTEDLYKTSGAYGFYLAQA